MDSSLAEIWQTAPGSPFLPTVGKGTQFTVGFTLLVVSLVMTISFALNRSVVNIIGLGIPASLSIAIGTVYMFCAVGVYV